MINSKLMNEISKIRGYKKEIKFISKFRNKIINALYFNCTETNKSCKKCLFHFKKGKKTYCKLEIELANKTVEKYDEMVNEIMLKLLKESEKK